MVLGERFIYSSHNKPKKILVNGKSMAHVRSYTHRNQTISRRWAYILADIHDMEHFCTKLAPRPSYNKPRSCVSKIHTPMVMVWFGNV
jgi:hypothetical protein